MKRSVGCLDAVQRGKVDRSLRVGSARRAIARSVGLALGMALLASCASPGGSGTSDEDSPRAAQSEPTGARVASLLEGSDSEVSILERDSIRILYWGDRLGMAERTLSAALAPLPMPGLPREVRLPPSTIVLAPDRARMDSIAGGRLPEWAAGAAIPARRLILLPSYQRGGPLGDPVVTLRHELAHLALGEYLERIPRWFDEGYATWVSGGWDETSGWQIRLALLRGSAPTLDSLTLEWPRSEARARLAYLLSASAVRFLATSRGEPAFNAFLQEWHRVGDPERAMRSVYHLDFEQFEGEWRAMVRRRYGWLLAFSQLSIFWFTLTLLVLLLGWRRRQRNRERLDALRREEYMLPPGPPPGVDDDSHPA